MTDESNKPSPDDEKPKVKRAIKIGSQRPGYVPDPPKERKTEVGPPKIPTPAHKQIQSPAAKQASAKPEPKPAQEPEASDSPAAPEQVEALAESAARTATQQIESAPEQDAASDPTAVVGETPTALPDIDLEMSDEDLEKEIAAAMGEGVENLLAGEISTQSEEIELDGRYQATALKVYRESVLFELPGQQNGAIPLKQFEEPPEPGTVIEVVVTGFSKAEQMYELVVPGASVDVVDWSDVQEGVVVEAKITGHNKGGLECEVNHIRGFIPASQVSLFRVEDFSTFVDQTLQCVVTEANPERRNLVLSHRAVLEREREAAREQLLAELEVGQIREGTVTRLQKFGAFVDLGGIDGLIHISQLSWDNIRHPSEVVAEGQQVKVRIEKLDPETGKIGLSYRDLMHHPWEGIDAKYPVGDVVTGTVSKIMDFGAFVKLESGVEGLVHISELSHKRVNRVSHVVEEGQRVEVKILTVDAEAQRISLSMKQAAGEPAEDADPGSDSEEPVVKHVPKVPAKSLKGGVGRDSGGEQFGLKW